MRNLLLSFFLFTGCIANSFVFARVSSEYTTSNDDDIRFYGSTIPAGTRFQIVDIPSEDAYYSDRAQIIGKTGKATNSLRLDKDGFTDGSVETDDGKKYYFYKVKLGRITGDKPSGNSTYVTGSLEPGTVLYLADISPEDAYYSDLAKYLGKKGAVGDARMTMKEGGYYAGDFKFDDGPTAYFYKARFSYSPVQAKNKSAEDGGWSTAENQTGIKKGDNIIVTAVHKEDSYFNDRYEYIGKEGVVVDAPDYDAAKDGYSGRIKMADDKSPYFYLVKLKKKSLPVSNASNLLFTNITKGTRIVITDIDNQDSFSTNKNDYIGKIGKAAEGLRHQENGFYSGLIRFEDESEAYFFKVKVTILK